MATQRRSGPGTTPSTTTGATAGGTAGRRSSAGSAAAAPAGRSRASTKRGSAGRTAGGSNRPTAPADDVGAGGELHQRGGPALTTQQGVVIADDQNSLKVGDRGPTLLDDFVLREKLFHFDHERIPERVVHARGYGAHGFFEAYESLEHLTTAAPFAERGRRTPVFVRFSTVAGNKGSADLARDVRGFAVKFYTPDGNWDLVGNNIPVFFVQDAMKFPDLVHAVKDEPDRGFPQAQSAHDNFWDFASLVPESTNMLMWVMSDRAIPRSFRFMEGFGVHTFRFIDADGASTFVKFHWKPVLGVQSVTWNEAVKINGADPDFHRRDLWDSITQGSFPEWELGIQVFDEAFADSLEFDVLDATKLIPEEVLPVQRVGRLVLDRVVDNFFAETEQVAFCTANVIPGIGFTNDPLLQGRNFSYLDTQVKRLGGPNFAQLPVNAPRCPVAHFQQDGHMAFTNPVGRVNYEPNSWPADQRGPREDPVRGYVHAAIVESGTTRRVRAESFADHYSQARQFLAGQTDVERGHIVSAFVFELSKVDRVDIRRRMVANLVNVDEAFASEIAEKLALELPAASPAASARVDLDPTPSLSILAAPPMTFAGRKLGILVADGSDVRVLGSLRKAFEKAGAVVEVVAPKIGGFLGSDGTLQPADHQVDGAPSVLFDAVALVIDEASAGLLAGHAPALDFVRDAHAHCKFVGWSLGAEQLIARAGVDLDEGWVPLKRSADAQAFLGRCVDLRHWAREAVVLAQ